MYVFFCKGTLYKYVAVAGYCSIVLRGSCVSSCFVNMGSVYFAVSMLLNLA